MTTLPVLFEKRQGGSIRIVEIVSYPTVEPNDLPAIFHLYHYPTVRHEALAWHRQNDFVIIDADLFMDPAARSRSPCCQGRLCDSCVVIAQPHCDDPQQPVSGGRGCDTPPVAFFNDSLGLGRFAVRAVDEVAERDLCSRRARLPSRAGPSPVAG